MGQTDTVADIEATVYTGLWMYMYTCPPVPCVREGSVLGAYSV